MTHNEIKAAMQRFPASSMKLIIIDDYVEKFYQALGLYWQVELKPWHLVPFEAKTWLREAVQEMFEGADVVLPRCIQPKAAGSPLFQMSASIARAALHVVPRMSEEAEQDRASGHQGLTP